MKKILIVMLFMILMSFSDSYADNAIKIAVIDTGINTSLFDNRFVEAFNVLENNANIFDNNGHGTKVYSVIDKHIDTYKNIQIIPIKVSENKTAKVKDVVDAIRYASSNGVDIINLSMSTRIDNTDLRNAIDDASSKGIFIVSGSGNTGSEEHLYPASYDGVISVGGVGVNNNITWFSTHNDKVDYVALSDYVNTINRDGLKVKSSGTSFSAPYVSAQIAILKTEYPNATNEEIVKALNETSLDGGEIGKDKYYGYGISSIELSKNQFFSISKEHYKEWKPMLTSDNEKQFTITYNKDIDNAGDIKVIDEYYNEYPINILIDRQRVIIKPQYKWNENQIFTLCIEGTTSKDGKMLLENVKMKFKVESDDSFSKRMANYDFCEFDDLITIEN